jgi:S1-C subfamily serine protease
VLTTGRVQRAWLGISAIAIEPELAAQFRLPVSEGIIVRAVGEDTPAARGGLRRGDIITRIGDTPMTAYGDFIRVLRSTRPETVVPVTVLRPDGARTLSIRLGVAPRS